MLFVSILLHVELASNDHREDALRFNRSFSKIIEFDIELIIRKMTMVWLSQVYIGSYGQHFTTKS